jgi:hypothetical protein
MTVPLKDSLVFCASFFFAVPGRASQYMGLHFFFKRLVMDPKTRKLVFNCKVVFFNNKSCLGQTSIVFFIISICQLMMLRIVVVLDLMALLSRFAN